MTHEEHVREVAEEMAKAEYPGYGNAGMIMPDNIISGLYTAARIAVRRESESFTAAWDLAFDGERDQIEYSEYCKKGDTLRIERGLIPVPEATLTPNVEQPSNAALVSPDKEIGCVFCGTTPMVFEGTSCATCGRSYRHG